MGKKTLLVILCVIFMGICIFQIYKLSKENIEYKNKVALFDSARAQRQQYLESCSLITTMIQNKMPSLSITDKIRSVMEFVNDNSLHLIDDEHRAYAFKPGIVVKKLILASRGQEEKKPHLSCGPRAYAMRDILNSFGIASRLIQIYSDAHSVVKGHRMLEVFNQETRAWELWDPDYRVTYVNRVTKKPENIINIVFGDIEKIIPKDNGLEGWEETKTEELKTQNYFGAVLFEQFEAGLKNSLILINQNKFNTNKIFEGGLTFKDWAMMYYGHPRFIYYPFIN